VHVITPVDFCCEEAKNPIVNSKENNVFFIFNFLIS